MMVTNATQPLGALAVIAIIVIVLCIRFCGHESEELKGHLEAAIELSEAADTTSALIIGYNYFLLKKFAEDNGLTVDISATVKGGTLIDSLKTGTIDILVVPFGADIQTDSVTASVPVDSISVWLTHPSRKMMMDRINSWIDSWHKSEQFGPTRDMFLNRFDAAKGRPRKCLSPYDDIIRSQADTMGWDWRLLAAVAYQESRFHIEARSHRGASGIMQITEATAKRFGVRDTLDPEANIIVGASYLNMLYRRFFKFGADRAERCKFALAAYNAGEGRIQDCINYAGFRGVDTSYWDNVNDVILEMNDTSILKSGVVKIGTFKGVETMNYVKSVMSVYSHFCRICPE